MYRVIWDRWADVSHRARSETILAAYEQLHGREIHDRIMFSAGMTFAEADDSGILSYDLEVLLRVRDPVTLEQCRDAMRKINAAR